jgi:hypothetical protein
MVLGRRKAELIAMFVFFVCASLYSQTVTNSSDLTTFRVETNLVLVDVIPEFEKTQLRTRALLTDLKREDFRIFDNRKEMAISSFDIGATHGTRPIALWLIVQCPQGFPSAWASDFLRDEAKSFRPALGHLDSQDAVGVAHWCDNGDTAIDLAPGSDSDAALAKVEEILHRPTIRGENRTGELAMQKMVRLLLLNVHETQPDRLPILLFFYGDHCATYPKEAEEIINDVLETSGIIFGVSDGRWPYDPSSQMSNGQVSYLVHYYSQETGGEFYTTGDPRLYSAALDYILSQVHLRYTIGFRPSAPDGKRHTLKVELTKEARSKYRGIQLRHRKVYIAVKRAAMHTP